jgi:four helix bundle protein
MAGVGSYRELVVWQKSIDLVVACYAVARRFPDSERFGVTSQLQRAAVSIPANIAEGHARNGPREFLHFLSIARGSLRELETLLIIANRVGYLGDETQRTMLSRTDEIARLLFKLSKTVAASASNAVPTHLRRET